MDLEGNAGRASGLPEVVREAEEYLRGRRRRLGLGAGAWTAAWIAINTAVPGVLVSPSLLWIPVAGAAAAYLLPVTRRARKATQTLRRWDEVDIERSLDREGAVTDPRLEVAEAMAARIKENARDDSSLVPVVSGLLEGLRTAVHDLRTLGLAQEAGGSSGHVQTEALEQLEARTARLLASLGSLHAAQVTRDAAALDRVTDEAQAVLDRPSPSATWS